MITNYQLKRVLYDYHEAGHAVVWHVVNGLIEAVSINSDQTGYKGYCLFGFVLHVEDDLLESDVSWLSSGRIHPKTVTVYYAGMLAMAYYCASYGGEDDYLEGNEQDDLERLNSLLLQLSPDEQQRSAMKDACWTEAQQILTDNWPAFQALATKLLKHRTLDGKDAHRIIWQTIGYHDADWRFGALNLQREHGK
jgi:hypothetical protein